MNDPASIAMAAVAGIASASATVVAAAWALSRSLARKEDIDKLRTEYVAHEKKDDDRWEAQGEKSEALATTLGRMEGSLETLVGQDRRASRPR